LDDEKILFAGQHGFRKNHSCETALHELLSDLNQTRDNKLISLLLFIDFRKAFDLVDSKLLMLKLFHYGFDNSSLNLISDYFKNRKQISKFNGTKSAANNLNLGVPQGSVLGPLFFLIFINDLAYLLKEVNCKLFADDTTLYSSDSHLDVLLDKFQKSIKPLSVWCLNNRMDINWSKTYCMFVSNKRVTFPPTVLIDNIQVNVVDQFTLLGVTVDHKLNFNKHVSNICLQINRKLFSIKRLFYLSTPVKIQFFKTFILPYFDYCLSLLIYFPKTVIQKLSNCYYLCLFKLFKMKFNDADADTNSINNNLSKFGLFAFDHRIFYRLFTFSYKIYNDSYAPQLLRGLLKTNVTRELKYDLRNKNDLIVSSLKNKFGELTFSHFFPKFINHFSINIISLNFSSFKISVLNNINLNFPKFINLFPRFSIYPKTFS
jgi:hypothetical protein